MLLIWDIHISSRLGDKIIKTLKDFVTSHPDEQNIIFLGDYVYHFSYDRNALLALYNFFVELFEEGKNIYVLAGNHDRLGQHFVYAEAKKAFDLINKFDLWEQRRHGRLYFITEPVEHTIEWEDILFLPYMLEPKNIPESFEASEEWRMRGVKSQIEELKSIDDKHKNLSASINSVLLKYIQEYLQKLTKQEDSTWKKLTVMHHYYFNKIKFPGQKARFYFKDISLSEHFLEAKNVKFMSGHLHQVFSYQNYLCLWSVRSTSSLENNQLKCLAKYTPQVWDITLYQNNINPYFFIENIQDTASLFEEGETQEFTLDELAMKKHIQEVNRQAQTNFIDHSTRNITFQAQEITDFSTITVNLRVQDLDYDKIDSYISPALRKNLKEVKLKKQQQNLSDLLEDFDMSSKNLSTSFSDRKNILKLYLKQKFGDDAEKYENLLREENLM